MYPVLVAVGGLLTLAFDYRRDALELVKRKTRKEESPVPLESDSGDALQVDVELAPVSSTSTLRRRVAPEPAPPVVEHTHIMTPSAPLAITMGVTLVVGVIALLVTRSQLARPPRALDFFCNMLVAGIIIFGGGPVVIPLLKGYTVDNGKRLYD